MKHNKHIFRKSAAISAATLSVLVLPSALHADPVTLENETFRITIDPAKGAHCTEFIIKEFGKTKLNPGGDLFNGHMSGGYRDEQNQAQYTISEQSPESVTLVWENPYLLFDGMVETRTISLTKDEVIWTLNIHNKSDVKKFMAYRIQEFLSPPSGTNGRPGIVTLAGPQPGSFTYSPELMPQELAFMDFTYPGCAIGNPELDQGILITVDGHSLEHIYLWNSDLNTKSACSTLEFNTKMTELAPDEELTFSVHYRPFRYSQTEQLPEPIRAAINERKIYDGKFTIQGNAPYLATMHTLGDQSLRIVPLAPVDRRLGETVPEGETTLQSANLFGTPGEKVNLALAMEANNPTQGVISFSDWQSAEGNTLPAGKWDSNYVMHDAMHLVKSFELAKTAPRTIATIGNDLKDAETLTEFQLNTGESAFLKNAYYIPENAKPGIYHSTMTIGKNVVPLQLEVMPYTLPVNHGKFTGSYFRLYLSNDNPAKAMTREEFATALDFVNDAWNRGIVLYMFTAEEIQFVTQYLYDLGWRNASIVILHDCISQEEVDQLSDKYGFTFYSWSVDEPSTYELVERTVNRLNALRDSGKRNPTITPDSALGAVIVENYPELIPQYVTNGFPQSMKLARERQEKGLKTMIYSCPVGLNSAERQSRERIIRGIALWQTPWLGVFDWGEDVESETVETSGFCGFIGKKPISTIRRDTTFEGFKDFLYLQNLEDLTKAYPDAKSVPAALKFLNKLRANFGDDYFQAGRNYSQNALDDIRREAAQLAKAIVEESK